MKLFIYVVSYWICVIVFILGYCYYSVSWVLVTQTHSYEGALLRGKVKNIKRKKKENRSGSVRFQIKERLIGTLTMWSTCWRSTHIPTHTQTLNLQPQRGCMLCGRWTWWEITALLWLRASPNKCTHLRTHTNTLKTWDFLTKKVLRRYIRNHLPPPCSHLCSHMYYVTIQCILKLHVYVM